MEPGFISSNVWIKENMEKGATVGMDSSQMSVDLYEEKEKFYK